MPQIWENDYFKCKKDPFSLFDQWVKTFLNEFFVSKKKKFWENASRYIKEYYSINGHRLKAGPGSGPRSREKTNPLKNRSVGKTGPRGLKPLLFISSHMEDNVEVIQFHIKSRDVLGLVFVQITFEKCTTNLSFENKKVGIEKTVGNL